MKKQHRFLLPTLPSGPHITINDPSVAHHIHTVLKLRPGEVCRLFAPETGDIVVTLAAVSKKEVLGTVTETVPAITIPRPVHAYVSITKRDTFELIVQKLTELGVSSITPVVSDRTIKQSLNTERLEKIRNEALEQSGHSHLPVITPAQHIDDAVRGAHNACYFDTYIAPAASQKHPYSAFFIGPEGGWSEREQALFQEHGISPASLGGTILRAETAAIVAAHTLIWQ